MSREAIEEVGLFDEELFAYREDLDWSLRAARAGRRVVVVPARLAKNLFSWTYLWMTASLSMPLTAISPMPLSLSSANIFCK